jgi:Pyruvate ferredoxin oxidoreductase beta subunit C terminal
VKFYGAYPMSPSTGVLHWIAAHARAKPESWSARWKTALVLRTDQETRTGPPHDPSDWHAAMKRALLWGDEIPIGKVFQRTDLPSLDQAEPVLDHGGPLAHRELRISPSVVRNLITELI